MCVGLFHSFDDAQPWKQWHFVIRYVSISRHCFWVLEKTQRGQKMTQGRRPQNPWLQFRVFLKISKKYISYYYLLKHSQQSFNSCINTAVALLQYSNVNLFVSESHFAKLLELLCVDFLRVSLWLLWLLKCWLLKCWLLDILLHWLIWITEKHIAHLL